MKLPQYKQFVLRLAVALVIIGGLYWLFIGYPSHRNQTKQLPDHNLYELRAALNENYLAVSGLSQIDSQKPSSGEHLKSLRDQVDKTAGIIEKLANEAPASTSGEIVASSTQLAKDEKDTIKQFDSKFGSYEKALSYNPSDDLGELDIVADKDKLATRASDTKNALEQIANKQSGELRIIDKKPVSEVILAASNCFDTLSQQLPANSAEAQATRQRCIDEYRQVRKVIVEDMASGFNQNNDSTTSKIHTIIEKVDSSLKR